MRLSTRGRFGVSALVAVGLMDSGGPVSLKSVAERQGISEHYLEQIMGPLRKAGLVHSVRGAQGGYRLAKEPSAISVGDVIRVLDGPIAPVECASETTCEFDHCARVDTCVTLDVWTRLRDSMVEVLDSVTLADLIKSAARQDAQPMYYI